MSNVAVIGVGALGRRHLQAILGEQNGIKVYGVETNNELLKSLQEEMPEVVFTNNIAELPDHISAAVIATSSNVRRMVFDELVSHCKIDNIIFEKVLFQKEEDYYHVKEILEEKGINAWVNCARREWDAYHQLKEKLRDVNEMHISGIGGQWGMGCNSIHILDLIEYLSGDTVTTIDITGLEDGIIDSKRKGFKEFFGTIKGNSGKCKTYQLTCIKESTLPFIITICTDQGRYIINETRSSIQFAEVKNNWEWQKEGFPLIYQSQLTGRVIKSILSTGKCNLSDYDSSMRLHLMLIRELIKFFNKNGMTDDLCPIT